MCDLKQEAEEEEKKIEVDENATVLQIQDPEPVQLDRLELRAGHYPQIEGYRFH